MNLLRFATLITPLAVAACASSPTDGATGSGAALALAGKVVAYAGGADGWAAVDRVSFTFNGARTIDWDKKAGHVRIENLTTDRPWKALDYDTRADQASADPVSSVENPAETAKAIWINDTYWLLAPLKVLDRGVRLSIDPAMDGDDPRVKRLRLRFDGVGLTPQNEYVLHVHEADGKVLAWDYYATADAEPRSWRFEEYGSYGPLTLSVWRPRIDGEGGIRLSAVRVR